MFPTKEESLINILAFEDINITGPKVVRLEIEVTAYRTVVIIPIAYPADTI